MLTNSAAKLQTCLKLKMRSISACHGHRSRGHSVLRGLRNCGCCSILLHRTALQINSEKMFHKVQERVDCRCQRKWGLWLLTGGITEIVYHSFSCFHLQTSRLVCECISGSLYWSGEGLAKTLSIINTQNLNHTSNLLFVLNTTERLNTETPLPQSWGLAVCCSFRPHAFSASTWCLVSSRLLQPREKGRMRFHKLQNVQIALDFLKHRQVSK